MTGHQRRLKRIKKKRKTKNPESGRGEGLPAGAWGDPLGREDEKLSGEKKRGGKSRFRRGGGNKPIEVKGGGE